MVRSPAVFVIAPRSTDPCWESKHEILRHIAADLECALIVPVYSTGLREMPDNAGVSAIRGADAILADLSFERPSSYYELGFAEAIEKTVILIARAGTQVHQTRHRNDVAEYDTLDDYDSVVRQRLAKWLAASAA